MEFEIAYLQSYSLLHFDLAPDLWPLPIFENVSPTAIIITWEIFRELNEVHCNFVATLCDNFERSYWQNDFDLLTLSQCGLKSNRLVPELCPTILPCLYGRVTDRCSPSNECDSDYHQNGFFCGPCATFPRILWKSVEQFLLKPPNKQTN